jgi:ribosomal protein S4
MKYVSKKKKKLNNKKNWKKQSHVLALKTRKNAKKRTLQILRALVLPGISYNKIYKKIYYDYRFQKIFTRRFVYAPLHFWPWHKPWQKFKILKKFIKYKKKRRKTFLLKQQLKSLLHPKFFKPWKYELPFLTSKQNWLRYRYIQYEKLSFKDRMDFFKTQLGQIMLNSTSIYPYVDFNKKVQLFSKNGKKARLTFLEGVEYFDLIIRQKKAKLKTKHKLSWYYENILRREEPYSVAQGEFKLTRLQTAFRHSWMKIEIEPWYESLFFKRAFLSVFEERIRKINRFDEEKLKYKFYLRRKNPRQEKRNKFYRRRTKLLFNFWNKHRIKRNKLARIKQFLGKLLRPFYGHLTNKQFMKIVKKNSKKKTVNTTRNELLLQSLESRLDVVVYRLNWAPHILWARRLIREGAIFISNLKKMETWSIMYSCLKKYAFPLKLRDPKNLYRKNLWNPHVDLTKQTFFLLPQKQISYLVQPGDIIQCAQGALSNQFKSNTFLFQKPMPAHLLVAVNTFQLKWSWQTHQMRPVISKDWDATANHMNTAVFLFNPCFKDLPIGDRINQSFFHWAIL